MFHISWHVISPYITGVQGAAVTPTHVHQVGRDIVSLERITPAADTLLTSKSTGLDLRKPISFIDLVSNEELNSTGSRHLC